MGKKELAVGGTVGVASLLSLGFKWGLVFLVIAVPIYCVVKFIQWVFN